MFIAQTDACTMPNSTTPLTPDQIAAPQQARAAMESIITRAQAAIDSVSTRPDMGPVVTSTQRFIAPRLLSNWPSMSAAPTGNGRKPAGAPTFVCTRQSATVQALGVRQGQAAPMPSLTTRPLTPAVVRPTTGNPCLDVQIGYALQSQLSKAMLWKCTQAGYFKTPLKPTVAPVLALANAGALPTIADQDVPPFDPAMLGMGDFSSGMSALQVLAIGGGLLLAGWAVFNAMKGGR